MNGDVTSERYKVSFPVIPFQKRAFRKKFEEGLDVNLILQVR